jgi:hypothetical protein
MKKYEHLSFRLGENPRDVDIKYKLKSLKRIYKKSYNELIKIGIESLCLEQLRLM